jgi:DNA repair protein RadC
MASEEDLIATASDDRGARRSIRDLPATERPRERLALRGPGGLSAAELVAVVWGTGGAGRGALELAELALARHGTVGALARASDAELEAIPGIGAAKAARLAAAFELGRRSVADWPAGRWTIRSPGDVAGRLMVDMGRLEREELRVLALNAKNVVQRATVVYVGNVSASLVRVGELFRDAVRLDASGVVLVHNHPSGDPTPSPDDLHLTAEAIAAGRLLDVDVLDHVVIGHDAWISLRDRGVTFDRPGRAGRPGRTVGDSGTSLEEDP